MTASTAATDAKRTATPSAFTLIELPKAVRQGFTLIELLVVVTIIVVLLALLVPALDKAMTKAELTTCAARQDGIVLTCSQYAMENNRKWPSGQRGDSFEHTMWVNNAFVKMVNPSLNISSGAVTPKLLIDPAFTTIGGYAGALGWSIGYQYLGGHPALSLANDGPGGFTAEPSFPYEYPKWESPISMAKAGSNTELTACIQSWSPAFGQGGVVIDSAFLRIKHSISAHSDHGGALGSVNDSPRYWYQGTGAGEDVKLLGALGANIGRTDGSVGWHDLADLTIHASGASSNGQDGSYPAYW